MGDQNRYCKHDTLAAYCGDCMIELRAENAELRKDAERYRWIRNSATVSAKMLGMMGASLDAAIDAAMKEQS